MSCASNTSGPPRTPSAASSSFLSATSTTTSCASGTPSISSSLEMLVDTERFALAADDIESDGASMVNSSRSMLTTSTLSTYLACLPDVEVPPLSPTSIQWPTRTSRSLLGDGASGHVYRVLLDTTPVAVKVLRVRPQSPGHNILNSESLDCGQPNSSSSCKVEAGQWTTPYSAPLPSMTRNIGTPPSERRLVRSAPLSPRTSNDRLREKMQAQTAADRAFYREQRRYASLSRLPGVARFYGSCQRPTDGAPAFVLELMEGGSVMQALDAFRTDPSSRPQVDTVLRIGAMIATALASVHRAGYSHGDIKPANCMLSKPLRKDGSLRSGTKVKLVDLGLSRRLSHDSVVNRDCLTSDEEDAIDIPTNIHNRSVHSVANKSQYRDSERLEAITCTGHGSLTPEVTSQRYQDPDTASWDIRLTEQGTVCREIDVSLPHEVQATCDKRSMNSQNRQGQSPGVSSQGNTNESFEAQYLALSPTSGPAMAMEAKEHPRSAGWPESSSRFVRRSSRSYSLQKETERGTPAYLSPEAWRGAPLLRRNAMAAERADVYALGMTLYQIETGEQPWPRKNEWQIFGAVVHGRQRPAWPEQAERVRGFRELVQACWEHDYELRPSCEEVSERLHRLIQLQTRNRSFRCVPQASRSRAHGHRDVSSCRLTEQATAPEPQSAESFAPRTSLDRRPALAASAAAKQTKPDASSSAPATERGDRAPALLPPRAPQAARASVRTADSKERRDSAGGPASKDSRRACMEYDNTGQDIIEVATGARGPCAESAPAQQGTAANSAAVDDGTTGFDAELAHLGQRLTTLETEASAGHVRGSAAGDERWARANDRTAEKPPWDVLCDTSEGEDYVPVSEPGLRTRALPENRQSQCDSSVRPEFVAATGAIGRIVAADSRPSEVCGGPACSSTTGADATAAAASGASVFSAAGRAGFTETNTSTASADPCTLDTTTGETRSPCAAAENAGPPCARLALCEGCVRAFSSEGISNTQGQGPALAKVFLCSSCGVTMPGGGNFVACPAVGQLSNDKIAAYQADAEVRLQTFVQSKRRDKDESTSAGISLPRMSTITAGLRRPKPAKPRTSLDETTSKGLSTSSSSGSEDDSQSTISKPTETDEVTTTDNTAEAPQVEAVVPTIDENGLTEKTTVQGPGSLSWLNGSESMNNLDTEGDLDQKTEDKQPLASVSEDKPQELPSANGAPAGDSKDQEVEETASETDLIQPCDSHDHAPNGSAQLRSGATDTANGTLQANGHHSPELPSKNPPSGHAGKPASTPPGAVVADGVVVPRAEASAGPMNDTARAASEGAFGGSTIPAVQEQTGGVNGTIAETGEPGVPEDGPPDLDTILSAMSADQRTEKTAIDCLAYAVWMIEQSGDECSKFVKLRGLDYAMKALSLFGQNSAEYSETFCRCLTALAVCRREDVDREMRAAGASRGVLDAMGWHSGEKSVAQAGSRALAGLATASPALATLLLHSGASSVLQRALARSWSSFGNDVVIASASLTTIGAIAEYNTPALAKDGIIESVLRAGDNFAHHEVDMLIIRVLALIAKKAEGRNCLTKMGTSPDGTPAKNSLVTLSTVLNRCHGSPVVMRWGCGLIRDLASGDIRAATVVFNAASAEIVMAVCGALILSLRTKPRDMAIGLASDALDTLRETAMLGEDMHGALHQAECLGHAFSVVNGHAGSREVAIRTALLADALLVTTTPGVKFPRSVSEGLKGLLRTWPKESQITTPAKRALEGLQKHNASATGDSSGNRSPAANGSAQQQPNGSNVPVGVPVFQGDDDDDVVFVMVDQPPRARRRRSTLRAQDASQKTSGQPGSSSEAVNAVHGQNTRVGHDASGASDPQPTAGSGAANGQSTAVPPASEPAATAAASQAGPAVPVGSSSPANASQDDTKKKSGWASLRFTRKR